MQTLSTLDSQNMDSMQQFNTFMQSADKIEFLIDLGQSPIFGTSRELELLKWESILFPRLQGIFFKAGARWAATRINYFDAHDRSLRSYMHSLCHFIDRMPPGGIELMALGLISPDPECAGCARDAVIQSIDSCRLDVEQIGAESSKLLHSQVSKAKRLAASLAEIARISEGHARAVIAILESIFKYEEDKMTEAPREIVSLLELLYELLEATGSNIKSDETRKYLQNLKSGGRAGRLAQQLLGRC